MRKRRTKSQRIRTFDNARGICCICKLPIDPVRDRWIEEHVKPLWLSGADDDTNIKPAHQNCAIQKTIGEATVRAKTDRVRARHLGIRKPSKWAYGKNSRLKKKVSGEVVER